MNLEELWQWNAKILINLLIHTNLQIWLSLSAHVLGSLCCSCSSMLYFSLPCFMPGGGCLCGQCHSPLFIGFWFGRTDEKHLQEGRFAYLLPRLPPCRYLAGSSFISLQIQGNPTALGKTNHTLFFPYHAFRWESFPESLGASLSCVGLLYSFINCSSIISSECTVWSLPQPWLLQKPKSIWSLHPEIDQMYN